MKLLVILLAIVAHPAWANELKLYVITPQFPIDWTSPQTLAVTTGANSIRDDYAPIGHFAVEVNCAKKNRFGVRHVLTGMERKNKKESQQITLDKKLGLGSLVYSFKGALQSSQSTSKEIGLARIDRRLTIVHIPTTGPRCQEMLAFLEDWINNGSYQVYGGGKKTAEGEGAGCADFAMEFLKIAIANDPPHEWMVRLRVPYRLMGNGRGKQVEFTEILKTMSWGTKQDGRYYEIADTNRAESWISKNLRSENGLYIFDQHLKKISNGFEYERPHMAYFYGTSIEPKFLWKQIRID